LQSHPVTKNGFFLTGVKISEREKMKEMIKTNKSFVQDVIMYLYPLLFSSSSSSSANPSKPTKVDA
jgi:hypothetical protein